MNNPVEFNDELEAGDIMSGYLEGDDMHSHLVEEVSLATGIMGHGTQGETEMDTYDVAVFEFVMSNGNKHQIVINPLLAMDISAGLHDWLMELHDARCGEDHDEV